MPPMAETEEAGSRPTWARGLKLQKKYYSVSHSLVAPHVGAWIETVPVRPHLLGVPSRPTWARGLKHFALVAVASLPCRAPRGRVD